MFTQTNYWRTIADFITRNKIIRVVNKQNDAFIIKNKVMICKRNRNKFKKHNISVPENCFEAKAYI